MNITIDGKSYTFEKPCTILEACKEVGIEVPNLCNDPRTKPLTSCFICVVEVKGARSFVPACSSRISNGMEIETNNDRIRATRKLCLELLFSDHAGDCYAPCSLTCPAGIDIQSYLAHTANKDYKMALKTIKDRNPLPLVCGRVCPKPCEEECRRNLMESAVAIDNVKRFLADYDLNAGKPFIPKMKKNNGKKIAIVGAGPAGLSAAYYLRIEGYDVDIFEAKDRPGGMLMWGIPEYRLPKKLLMQEINIITDMGAKINYNKALGKDITLQDLKTKYDSVFLAIGAQISSKMRVKNETTKGVFGGIDFLYEVARGTKPNIGKKVIVVGGGNTAIDAARTSIRMGAEVTIVYRRTKEEMPAENYEIEEAELEGVNFRFLLGPSEVLTENGKITGLHCQVMKQGEPDSSGRRRPVPIEGKVEIVKADSIIAAIGQSVDSSCLQDEKTPLELTAWQTIVTREQDKTFATNIPGIFAGGDAVTGPSIAIGAIAHGMYTAKSIHAYCSGTPLIKDFKNEFNFTLGKKLTQVNSAYLPQAPSAKREENKHKPIKERLNNFEEVEFTFTEDQAQREAKRCLSCGCLDAKECRLKQYAEDYSANINLIKGEMRVRKTDNSSKHLVFDSTKCIKCGKCIRVCDELKGIGALGFVGRGFQTDVLPAIEMPLMQTTCVECGQCEIACPTGAILDKSTQIERLAQFPLQNKDRACTECSIGCETTVSYLNSKAIKVYPKHRGEKAEEMLCCVGRYDVLDNFEASEKFSIDSYKTLKLYSKAIENLPEAIENAEVIINYNTNIFKYYAPVSSYLKRQLDKENTKQQDITFFFKEEQNIFAFGAYKHIDIMTRNVSINDYKELQAKIQKGKRTLIMLEETALSPEELDFFVAQKNNPDIEFLNLVRRQNL